MRLQAPRTELPIAGAGKLRTMLGSCRSELGTAPDTILAPATLRLLPPSPAVPFHCYVLSTSTTTAPLNRCHEWKEALAKANLFLLMETLKNQVDAGPAGHNVLAYC